MKTIFGEITDHEKQWLNQELKKVGWTKTVDELYGIPSFYREDDKRKVSVYPFVYQFFERHKASQANWDNIMNYETR